MSAAALLSDPEFSAAFRRLARDGLAFAAPVGRMPTIEWVPIGELRVDPTYQRSIDGQDSRRQIRTTAETWSWDLCDVLKVSRRPDDNLFVVDGQHRLAAAELRGDLPQLPCVIKRLDGAAAEAALFVAANRGRKKIAALDEFRAGVSAGDADALAVMRLVEDAGLTLAPHTNFTSWKPRMIAHVAGIKAARRRNGDAVVATALAAIAAAWPAQALRCGAVIFAGLVPLLATRASVDPPRLAAVLASRSQLSWLGEQAKMMATGLGRAAAMAEAIRRVLDANAAGGGVTASPPRPKPAARPRTFDEQMAAVAAGAPLTTRVEMPRAAPTMTLGGVGSGML